MEGTDLSEKESEILDAEEAADEGSPVRKEGKEMGGETDELRKELEKEKEKAASQEKKIQYLLADFENLKKRSELDVQNKVDVITDGMILKFLSIYDDFVRARDALFKQNVNTAGLDAILKNMNGFLSEYGVKPIDALGEIFDPKLHEAIAIKQDPSLEDDTVTAELRKGYILKDRIIRPSLVEISKKQTREMN
ncbi:MAG TPA: nucleotide exchange factor GrpE [Candidatus Nitrosotalea sp.]|nr:nucleotide exchange factor GrpE [Candidatus Nitrosotalea sp.]